MKESFFLKDRRQEALREVIEASFIAALELPDLEKAMPLMHTAFTETKVDENARYGELQSAIVVQYAGWLVHAYPKEKRDTFLPSKLGHLRSCSLCS